jgi:hypothetical protein
MNKILVNASGAKIGGSLTILNAFCRSKIKDHDFYFIISPIKPDVMPLNSRWIKIETNGLSTLLFSVFFSFFYYVYFDCNKLLSFSNVNNVFPITGKITYFHNILICGDSGFKYKIIRFVLRNLNQRKSKYIFQTDYVKQCFESELYQLISWKICWPGFERKASNVNIGVDFLNKQDEKFFLIPITNLNDAHKKFEFIVSLATHMRAFYKINFLVTSCREQWDGIVPDNIKFIGNLSHDYFLNVLSFSEGVIITSSHETVCLPIFESILLGKPSYVLKARYLEGLFNLFGEIEGLNVFEDVEQFVSEFKVNNVLHNDVHRNDVFHLGDWEFYE